MASAIARPNLYFQLQKTRCPRETLVAPPFVFTQKVIFTKPLFITCSLDVSQEDKPVESKTDPNTDTNTNTDIPTQEEEVTEQELNIDPRRLEEKFAVLNTGIYECRSCGYLYNQAVGDPAYPIAPGMNFSSLPSDWRCPTCGAAQSFFESKSFEIAGFAQNQQFGLGGNSLTGGQKTLLIYGSLFLFFGLFLSGYFLQ